MFWGPGQPPKIFIFCQNGILCFLSFFGPQLAGLSWPGSLGYLLGVLSYSDLLELRVLGYSDLLGLGVPDEWLLDLLVERPWAPWGR